MAMRNAQGRGRGRGGGRVSDEASERGKSFAQAKKQARAKKPSEAQKMAVVEYFRANQTEKHSKKEKRAFLKSVLSCNVFNFLNKNQLRRLLAQYNSTFILRSGFGEAYRNALLAMLNSGWCGKIILDLLNLVSELLCLGNT